MRTAQAVSAGFLIALIEFAVGCQPPPAREPARQAPTQPAAIGVVDASRLLNEVAAIQDLKTLLARQRDIVGQREVFYKRQGEDCERDLQCLAEFDQGDSKQYRERELLLRETRSSLALTRTLVARNQQDEAVEMAAIVSNAIRTRISDVARAEGIGMVARTMSVPTLLDEPTDSLDLRVARLLHMDHPGAVIVVDPAAAVDLTDVVIGALNSGQFGLLKDAVEQAGRELAAWKQRVAGQH